MNICVCDCLKPKTDHHIKTKTQITWRVHSENVIIA